MNESLHNAILSVFNGIFGPFIYLILTVKEFFAIRFKNKNDPLGKIRSDV